MIAAVFHLSTSLEVWIGALLTLMIFSFLWRDNPFYKLAEHVFVGVSAAYWMVVGFWTTFWPNVVVKLFPGAIRVTNPEAAAPPADPMVLVPVGLGLLMLAGVSRRTAWLSRWPTAFILGATAGYTVVRTMRSEFLYQIQATVGNGLVAFAADGSWDPGTTLARMLVLAGTVSGLVYFTFTRTGRGGQGALARTGLIFMMITFGATFGYAVMGRISLLIGRLNALLGDWLGVV